METTRQVADAPVPGRASPPGLLVEPGTEHVQQGCQSLLARSTARQSPAASIRRKARRHRRVELAYALDDLRLDGVVLLSNYDGYYLGDPRFDRLFAELDRRGVVVFVHPRSPPAAVGSHLNLPEAVLDVCFDTTRTAFSLIVNGVTKRHPRDLHPSRTW